MKPLLLVAAMFVVPIVGGILLGLIQMAVYLVLVRSGRLEAARAPAFVVLFARGMLVVVVLAIVLAVIAHLANRT